VAVSFNATRTVARVHQILAVEEQPTDERLNPRRLAVG
jgi:hypothetical protein